MQYKYGLDPSSKKYTCPQCNHKSMVVYLDNEMKAPVDEYRFGRCDRENSCGYHSHPNEDPELAAKKAETFIPVPATEVVQKFPDESVYGHITNKTKTCISPLHAFCNKKLLIPNEHLLRWGVYSDKDGDLTVYIFRNFNNEVVNLKWFKYKEDGHRDKNFDSYSLKNPKTPPHPPKSVERKNFSGGKEVVEKYQMCLYGEHLLPRQIDDMPVCVVESEKTAVIASFFYKQFHWVSCGSNNGVTDGTDGRPDKIKHLKGRKVYWVGDADSASRMRTDDKGIIRPSSVRHLIEHIDDFHVVDLFPDRTDGYDIGDAIVDGLRPEIKPTWSKGEEQAPEVPREEDSDLYDYDLPKNVKWNDVKWDIRKYMHFEHDGRIYIVRKRKGGEEQKGMGSYYCSPITNFTIKSLGLIASEIEPTRLVEIKNIHGYHQVVKVPTKAFASPTEFTVFMESVGNFQYDGVGTDLKKIRAKLYDTMLTFDEVENLGWHYTGYFLFANGAYNGKFNPIDKYGFVKLGEKNFFIQPLSCIIRENSEEWEDEKKFIYKEKNGDVGLKQWAELFCKVHKDNGKIALAWYIAALFRDVIYQRFKFFPHIHLFGPPGTGKSQVGWSIRSLGFTGLVKPFNLNTGTAVAFHREFSHFKNFPAWCDEYSNSIPFERIQAIKAAYDGVGHKKSVKDSEKRTKSTQVNRAIMISGQELPIADNALFKRVILLQFHQTEYTAEEKKLFADLQNMEEGGLTFITAGFMHFRKLIEEKYHDAFDDVLNDLMKEITAQKFDVEDRIVRNAAIALTAIKVLEEKLNEHLPYTYDELKLILVKNIKEQMSLITNSNETNQFWDIVMFLARKGNDGIKEGEDFVFDTRKTVLVTVNRENVIKELPKTTELIFIRFTKILPLYREAFRRQNSGNASPMDKGSLMHYLQYSKPFVGLVGSHQFKDNRTSCYCFDYEMLKSMGIYLGGSEGNSGTPPPANGDSSGPVKLGGPDDLPF
jgi:hypothetical protein